MRWPYRFLNFYDFKPEDIAVFKGRKHETRLLVSDIINNRLVVLFAPTGTGKSSLINAGVRPELERLDYKTILIRVRQDPAESALATLRELKLLNEKATRLPEQLRAVVAALDMPVVLLFDQFEEFFLYACAEPERREQAQQFILDVAELFRDRNSGVHIVFSLREDFFVEMEVFRDEIPTIFHSGSNLRLRPFDREQAQAAIVQPAMEVANVTFEPALLEQLLDDLGKDRIEPTRLQIACDTLWRDLVERTGGNLQGAEITGADYARIGPVERLLDDRFRDDISSNLTDDELTTFERVLPFMRRDERRGTKSVVSLSLLSATVGEQPTRLNALVDKLEEDLRLIRKGPHGTIEWASDYLSGRLDYLIGAVRGIKLRRTVHQAIERAAAQATELRGRTDEEQNNPPTEKEIEALYMRREDFEEVSRGLVLLTREGKRADAEVRLGPQQVEFLLVASLEHGTYLRVWAEEAIARNIDIWALLRQKITDPSVRSNQAESAVRMAGDQGASATKGEIREAALALLGEALLQQSLAEVAVAELGRIPSPAATELLSSALKQQTLSRRTAAVISRDWTPQARALLSRAVALPVASRSQPAVQPEPGREGQEQFGREDWNMLLRVIKDGRCLPVIGFGNAAQLAESLAAETGYPFADRQDLARVSQFATLRYDRAYVHKALQKLTSTDDRAQQVATSLARLPLPVYLTTRFDDVLGAALAREGKSPWREHCHWALPDSLETSRVREEQDPTAERPLVFHLQGRYTHPDSPALTVSDRLSLLMSVAADPDLILPRVQRALASSMLLLVDCGLHGTEAEWLLAMTENYTRLRRARNLIVFDAGTDGSAWRSYANELFGSNFKVYWGDSRQFAAELAQRWGEFTHGRSGYWP